ncbi:MAG: Ig-like domain-containing protein [Thermomicrobiales bacterium]
MAVDDQFTITGNVAVVLDVLANDFDPDGDPLSIVSVSQPAQGTAGINNGGAAVNAIVLAQAGDDTLTYTPDGDFVGSDSFSYTISDGRGGSDTASVSIFEQGAADDGVDDAEDDDAEDVTALPSTGLGGLMGGEGSISLLLVGGLVSLLLAAAWRQRMAWVGRFD